MVDMLRVLQGTGKLLCPVRSGYVVRVTRQGGTRLTKFPQDRLQVTRISYPAGLYYMLFVSFSMTLH